MCQEVFLGALHTGTGPGASTTRAEVGWLKRLGLSRAELDYHREKTRVKRSIEQNLRNNNFGARNGNYKKNAVVKNQGTKQREQRILGDCWQWESNGQCSRGDN